MTPAGGSVSGERRCGGRFVEVGVVGSLAAVAGWRRGVSVRHGARRAGGGVAWRARAAAMKKCDGPAQPEADMRSFLVTLLAGITM